MLIFFTNFNFPTIRAKPNYNDLELWSQSQCQGQFFESNHFFLLTRSSPLRAATFVHNLCLLFFYSQEAAWCPLRPATHPPLSCASSARTGAGAFFGSFAAAHPLQWNAHHMCDGVEGWMGECAVPHSASPIACIVWCTQEKMKSKTIQ